MKLDNYEISQALAEGRWHEAAAIVAANTRGPASSASIPDLPVHIYGMNPAEETFYGRGEIRIWAGGSCAYWNRREGFGEEIGLTMPAEKDYIAVLIAGDHD
jgi:hypothetical protein